MSSLLRPQWASVTGTVSDTGDHDPAVSAASDTITAAGWTIVSRVTGLIRFAVIGAVLGPTFFGNTYQFLNALPNLVFFGFLAGTLFPSLLAPALVGHIDADDRRASERVAGGFLGVTLVVLAVITPLAIILGPLALKVGTLGGGSQVSSAAQIHVGRLLILMFIPQVFCYAIVGTAIAAMNSRHRFALAAGAPAVENLGTMAVLGATAVIYGTGPNVTNVPNGEILLLGLGSTAAVALHAATQWWGAKRAGIVLLPRLGWRDPEVRVVIRRAIPSIAQAGLVALQTLVLLMLANREPGGVVAFQIALSFYQMAIWVGAAPVALTLTPRLARMHLRGDLTAFRGTVVRGLALGFFVTIPAAVGYLALAGPLARAVSFGRMDSASGVTMVAVALASLSVAVIAQTAFMILTYASYAGKDTRSPLNATLVQAAVCLGLASTTLLVHGPAVLVVLGLTLSASIVAAAFHLAARTWRNLSRPAAQQLVPSLAKFLAGAAIMAGPAWVIATVVPHVIGRPLGPRVGMIAAALVGGTVFLTLQHLWGAPELRWLAGGLTELRGRGGMVVAEATHG